MKKKNSTVNTIIIIIGLTFFAKAIGFIRDAKIGGVLGASAESDAYFSALNITSIFFSNITAGIGASLIPTIVKLINREKDEAIKKINNVINAMLLFSFVITIVGILLSPQLVSWFAEGYTGDKYNQTVLMTAIMMPSIVFISLTYVFVAYLQANNSFIIPSIISLPANIIMLVFMYVGYNRYGIIGLTIITVVGWMLQWIIQLPVAAKFQYRYRFYLNFKDEDLRHFLKIMVPIIFVSAVYQINIIIDNMFSASFGDGKVTHIYYANILYSAIVSTTVLGVTAVMFPKFSKSYTKDGIKEFYQQVTSVVKGLSVILIPMGVGVALLAEPIIRLVFERGEFDNAASLGSGQILAAYALAMLAYGVIDVLNKGFYTISNTKAPVIAGAVIIVSNFILSLLLKNISFIGIPVATTISFYIGAGVMIFLFHNKENRFIAQILPTIMKSVVAVGFMAIAVYGTITLVGLLSIQSAFASQGITIILSIIVGVVVYGCSLLLLREEIVWSYWNAFIHRKEKKKI